MKEKNNLGFLQVVIVIGNVDRSFNCDIWLFVKKKKLIFVFY